VSDSRIMTDAEVARLLGVSARTLKRRMKRPRAGELDLNKAKPTTFGGRRLWLRANVEELLGIENKGEK